MTLKKKILYGIIITAVILAAACGIYVSDYYHAGEQAIAVAGTAAADYTCQHGENTLVFMPAGEADAGLIFYPGGKVEYTAYAPLMEQLAEQGVLCVLVKMPANLAVLDMGAAEAHLDEFPDIENWYVGGHSLGGSMAASYAAEHADELEGLLLLAAYSTADLTGSGLDVLSIYGSEDGVLNLDKYNEYRPNLPEETTTEIILEGGNHAGFGSYGPQEGDGTSTLEPGVQLQWTADRILEFIQE